ncbi:MAG: hypothetical protein MJE77_13870 [Proteobacteria bacterium]|nr:hypothetical protein [Pseudomonadota bacterium]
MTVQEYLVIPRRSGEDAYHRARKALDILLILPFDRAAAEEAARLELAKHKKAYLAGANSRTEAKRWWFRDAAIVGTAVVSGAECIFTREGPMLKMDVLGVRILSI